MKSKKITSLFQRLNDYGITNLLVMNLKKEFPYSLFLHFSLFCCLFFFSLRAMKFLKDCSILKIEDILPFFPDFVTIDYFKV